MSSRVNGARKETHDFSSAVESILSLSTLQPQLQLHQVLVEGIWVILSLLTESSCEWYLITGATKTAGMLIVSTRKFSKLQQSFVQSLRLWPLIHWRGNRPAEPSWKLTIRGPDFQAQLCDTVAMHGLGYATLLPHGPQFSHFTTRRLVVSNERGGFNFPFSTHFLRS